MEFTIQSLRTLLAKIAAQGDATLLAIGLSAYTHSHGGVSSPAPADATYLTTTANGTLTNEVAVGATYSAIHLTATVRVAAGVPAGAPTGTELPVAADTTAVTGGVYMWTGAAWVKVATV